MDINTGRPDHIEDYLCSLKNGSWFGFKRKNGNFTHIREEMVYENLVTLDGSSKPSKVDCINGLKLLQDNFDSQDYKRKRHYEYPSVRNQLDDLYKQGLFSPEMMNKIKLVKEKYPKPI